MPIIDLLRHGEPVGGRRYRGSTDDPLSPLGWQQMEDAVVGGGPWEAIVTSPLRRCRDFSIDWGRRHGVPVSEDVRLQEMGFGNWEGKTPADLRREDPEMLRRFFRDPACYRPVGAEDLLSFRGRVVAAWEDIERRFPGEIESALLLVAHAGVIRAIVSHILEIPVEKMFSIQVENAALVRVQWDEERPASVRFGAPCAVQ